MKLQTATSFIASKHQLELLAELIHELKREELDDDDERAVAYVRFYEDDVCLMFKGEKLSYDAICKDYETGYELPRDILIGDMPGC